MSPEARRMDAQGFDTVRAAPATAMTVAATLTVAATVAAP